MAVDYGGVAVDYGGVAADYGGVAADYGGVAVDYGGVAADCGVWMQQVIIIPIASMSVRLTAMCVFCVTGLSNPDQSPHPCH